MEARQSRWSVHRNLRGDRKLRVRGAGEDIEDLIESYQKQEAWKRLAHWYRQASGRQSPPSREHLDRISTKRAELYRFRPPEGVRVTILVTPAAVEYRIPGEEEMAQAVRILKRGRAGGTSGMRAEYLKEWFREESRETDLVTHQW